MRRLSFTVHGEPVPQGSKIAVQPKGHLRPVIIDANQKDLRRWRSRVVDTAVIARGVLLMAEPFRGPVSVTARFFFAKPPSVPRATTEKFTKPDLDKLVRAVLDSLEEAYVVVGDQIVMDIHAWKGYGDPRVEVVVEEWTGGLI